MDVPIINESCFSAANPCSYSLTEIWPPSSSSFSPLQNPNSKQSLTLELSAETQLSVDDSSLTYHSRNRNHTISDFQSSRIVSDKDLVKDSSSKRLKVLVSNQENSGSKDAAEASSGSGNKPAEAVKDYVHVRAKRGQATDSHSLAERARREKISERMKVLQDLVPGCNKVVGKALVLDEIINYIQSLQNQVEFLSMKLEAVNSTMEPAVVGFPMKNLGVPTLDASGLIFGSQSPQEYGQGSQRDWLHMQIGSTIEKQLDT